MNSNVIQYDVIIVGAGIVGSALACALAGTNLSVALIEAQSPSAGMPDMSDSIDGYDARVSALTVASQNFLQQLGVWSAISDCRISPYNKMHVWDAEGTGAINFDASDINQPALGHIVENKITAAVLMQRIFQATNIQLIAPATLLSVQPMNDDASLNDQPFYRLALEDGQQLQAPLVVAADGANSKLRSLTDVDMREWDYDHHAIVATVETQHPHQQTAWQRFLPEGPLAFLPLTTAEGGQQYCSIVWSAIPQYAENLMQLDDQAFSTALAQAFEHRLGGISAVSRRFSFPLRQRHAVNYVKPGLALVGDAAHTIHPLAGQGVNLGLMDAQVLSEELIRANHRQLDLGSKAVLNRYQRRRKASNLSMMAGMDGFKWLFEQQSLPVRWARNTGMRWLDGIGGVKKKIMKGVIGV